MMEATRSSDLLVSSLSHLDLLLNSFNRLEKETLTLNPQIQSIRRRILTPNHRFHSKKGFIATMQRGLPVHYIGSETHNRQAKQHIQGWDLSTVPNIHFHDFSLPSFKTPPADPTSTNKLHVHLVPTFEAATHLRAPLSELLASLSLTSKRVIVIHDSLMLFAAQEATYIDNGEAYSFNSISVFSLLIHKWESLGRPINEKTEFMNKFPQFPTDDLFNEYFHEFMYSQMEFRKFDSGDLYNTSNAIEGPFIDLLDQEPFNQTRDKWVIGPFNPITLSSSTHTSNSSTSRNKCLQWLDQQPERSVLYVSFGSVTSISDEQIKELAIGLENSGQRFIWVLRDADRGDIFAGTDVRRIELPEGYEERLKNIGMVVRNWAPQLEILAHKSTGGFMSHCGWNSCMESLSLRVLIAAWAMHSDQPWNSLLITEVLKVGSCVQEWTSNAEFVTAIDIESIVLKLMDSSEGMEVRKRAEDLGVQIRGGMMEGHREWKAGAPPGRNSGQVQCDMELPTGEE